jgi:hypothetical protein
MGGPFFLAGDPGRRARNGSNLKGTMGPLDAGMGAQDVAGSNPVPSINEGTIIEISMMSPFSGRNCFDGRKGD